MTAQEIDWRALRAPSQLSEIAWRVGPTGFGDNGPWIQVVPYVTARAIQERFDNACGPANWQNSEPVFHQPNTYQVEEWDKKKKAFVTKTRYVPGRVSIGIGVRIGDEWIWKHDGANETNVEPFKGGVSNAEKRAAVQWGVGRDLYDDRFKRVYAIVLPGKDGAYDRAWVKDKKNSENSRSVYWKLKPEFVPTGAPQDPDPNVGNQQPPPAQNPPPSNGNGSREVDATADVRKDFADQALEIMATAGLKATSKFSLAMMEKVNTARTGTELRRIIGDIKKGLQAGAKARSEARNAAEQQSPVDNAAEQQSPVDNAAEQQSPVDNARADNYEPDDDIPF